MDESVLALVDGSGLSRIARNLTTLLMYSIRMKIQRIAEDELPLGSSKVGGMADLPLNTVWPTTSDDELLAFIAQIYLPDIAEYDREDVLPHTGILYFFFYENEQGFYPPDEEEWRVLYYNGDVDQLQRVSLLTEGQRPFSSCSVTFSTEITLPPFESTYLEQLDLSSETLYGASATSERREEANRYMELKEKIWQLYGEEPFGHKLLGHPDQLLEDDMQMECQLFTHGLDWFNYQQSDTWPMLQKHITDWRLLLQLNSDEDAGFMWGNFNGDGVLYYWIPKEALEQRDFDKVWVVQQLLP